MDIVILLWGDGNRWISEFTGSRTSLVRWKELNCVSKCTPTRHFCHQEFHPSGSNVPFDITKAPFMEELHYRTSALHNLLCHLHIYQSERAEKGGSRLAKNQRWHGLKSSKGQKWKDRIGSYVISFVPAGTDALCKRQINKICYVL